MMHMSRTAIVLAILSVWTVSAFSAETSSSLKSTMRQMMQQNPQLMQEIMANPRHRLAMGYRNNLINFAQVLKQAAQANNTVPGGFARTAIGEMRRSVDLLEKEHAAVLNGMPADKKAALGDISKLMHEHLADVHKRLDHLDALAKEDQVASKDVLKDLDFILEHCQMAVKGMRDCSGIECHHDMQGAPGPGAEMESLVQRMNQAPDNEKIGIMAEIINRLVETQMHTKAPMQGMAPHGMHPMMQQQMDHKSLHQDMPHGDADMNMDEEMDIEEVE